MLVSSQLLRLVLIPAVGMTFLVVGRGIAFPDISIAAILFLLSIASLASLLFTMNFAMTIFDQVQADVNDRSNTIRRGTSG